MQKRKDGAEKFGEKKNKVLNKNNCLKNNNFFFLFTQ